MLPALRNRILQVHRWAGLGLGLWLVLLAVTGGGLVFRDQLAPLLQPRMYQTGRCAVPLPLDVLAARAAQAIPEARLDQLRLIGPGMPLVVRFADRRDVYVDTCSGHVLGQRAHWEGVLGSLEQWHRLRFLGNDGVASLLTGALTLALLLVFVLGGWVVRWPDSLAILRRSLVLPRKLKGRALDVNLHRTAGVYASLVLLVVAATALPIAFKPVRHWINLATGSAPLPGKPHSAAPALDAAPVSMQSAWQQALALVPGATRGVLHYPHAQDAALELAVLAPDAPHMLAASELFLDAYSGAVLRYTPYEQMPSGHRLYSWIKAAHMGYIGGWPGQCLLLLGMLSVPLMGYTGISSYLRRRLAAQAMPNALPVRVLSIRDEADGVRSYTLGRADGRALPSFAPGAHIDVHIDLGLVRPYSLCGDPNDRGSYLIAVQRSQGSRGGSLAMHERVAQGDELTISAPRNHFPLRPRARRHLLLAGGIGITPLLCMVRYLQRRGERFELHYFAAAQAEAAFTEWLGRAELQGKVHFHWGQSPRQLDDYLQELLQPYAEGDHLYVSGPCHFTAAVQAAAQPAWPQQAVHEEHFAVQSVAVAREDATVPASAALPAKKRALALDL